MKLKLKKLGSTGIWGGRLGLTLPELLIASVIGIAVSGAILVLVIETAQQQRQGLADASLLQRAGMLEDQLGEIIRSMSASETASLTDKVDSAPFYERVVFAKGKAPDWPREEVRFNPATLTVTHDPDIGQGGDEIVLFSSTQTVKLRQLYFFISMKPGGIPDGATLNVIIELDDDGFAGRRNPDGSIKPTSVLRTFTVRMRNI